MGARTDAVLRLGETGGDPGAWPGSGSSGAGPWRLPAPCSAAWETQQAVKPDPGLLGDSRSHFTAIRQKGSARKRKASACLGGKVSGDLLKQSK